LGAKFQITEDVDYNGGDHMTLSGSVELVTNENQPAGGFWPINCVFPFAAGENNVFYVGVRYDASENPVYVFSKLNLKTGAATSADVSGYKRITPLRAVCGKSGYIDLQALATDTTNEYARIVWFRIDVSDMTSTVEKEIQFATDFVQGNVVQAGDVVYTRLGDTNQLNILNLRSLSNETVSMGVSGSYYILPITWLCDVTTNKPYVFWQQHYWAAGSYTSCGFFDPVNKTGTGSTDFDANSGALGYPSHYLGTDGKLRYIYFGCSGGYTINSYYAKWYLLYMDNGSLVSEATIDGRNFTSGNHCAIQPLVLGITPDNTLAVVTVDCSDGAKPTYDYTLAVDLVEATNTLGTPTKVSHATVSYTANEYHGTLDSIKKLWVLEDDWTVRVPLVIYPYDTSTSKGKVNIAKITLNTDLDFFNPYQVVSVPETGLIPTTLTLTITKV